MNEYIVQYDYCEVVDMHSNDTWITRNAETLRWLDGNYFKDSTIRVLLFYKEESDYEVTYCVVTGDNEHLVESWLNGNYLLERYAEQDGEFTLQDIYGEWKIIRLDSYDNTYQGNIKDGEGEEERTKDLLLSDFYAPEWFEKKVSITKEYLEIDTDISGQITGIQSQIVNKELFEQEQGIHDGLSLNNEEVLIYQITYGEKNETLTVVPVNKDKIIIHIDMGWFVLEKDEKMIESAELQKIYGEWNVAEYLGSGVEYSGIDVNDTTYIVEKEKNTEVMQQKYLGATLRIEADNILFFGAPCELGYYYNDYSELFSIYRQPAELKVTPPFMCVEIQLKDVDEIINIINDKDDVVVLEVGGYFFRLERVNE